MSFGRFLLSKAFYKHTAIILGVLVVLLFVVIKGLDFYTHQGEYLLVPDLQQLDSDSLIALSDPNSLQYVLTDSIYDAKSRPGSVSRQYPFSGAKVKIGRKIYLTIVTKGQEYIPMPNLVDLTIRRAVDVISQSKLKVNQLIFVENFARNAVLAQLIRQDTIEPETLVLIGSSINLIVGNGHNSAGVIPPFLIGKTAKEAKEIILKSSLNIGRVDTLWGSPRKDLRVYQQYPNFDHKENIFLGDEMQLSLRSGIDFNFDSLIFNLLNDTITKHLEFQDSLLLPDDLEEF